jgi:hypothetical protein
VRIANDERLSILKEYARKHFRLSKNVRTLVLLISEKETRECRELAARKVETNPALQEFIKQHPPNTADHETLEILPTEACLINVKKNLQIKVLRELITKSKTKIRHFEKYEYVILIREELLEPFGKRKFSSFEGCDANFAELALCWLLTHEFLHIIEEVTGIQIYGSQEKDDIHQLQVLNTLPQEYWGKGTKNGVVKLSF